MSQQGAALSDDATETTALVSAIVSWVYTFFILFLAIIQSNKVSNDLFSCDHGFRYKLIQCSTVICIYFCLLSVISGDLMYLSRNDKECATRWTLILNFQQFEKTMTYLILLARLNQFYYGTSYAISQNALLRFAIGAIVVGVICLFSIIIFPINATLFEFNSSYPSWCIVTKGEFNLFYFAGAIIIIQDILAAAAFIFLFTVRWKKIQLEIIKKKDDYENSKQILYYVSKVKVLSTTMLILTVVFTLISIITGLGVFAQTDLVVIPTCLVLMTPYWPDHQYYSKICCLCHTICCGKGEPSQDGQHALLLNKFAMKADSGGDQPQVQMDEKQQQTSTL
eukprot:269813_1